MNKKLLQSLYLILFISISFSYFRHTAGAHDDPTAAIRLFPSQADYFVGVTYAKDPAAALALLRTQSNDDDTVAENCHDLAHLIGHTAMKKYGNFGTAMSYFDEICNSGYIHGAIEEAFAAVADPLAMLSTICSAYAPGSFLGWQCFHGVGHGLMFSTDYDLPRSITLCGKFDDTRARASCTNGVFMENFNADGDRHKSTYVKTDDLFYPCQDMPSSLKDDCYIYAPVHYLNLHPRDYLGALAWCRTAPLGFQATCTIGAGGQFEKEQLHDPAVVERACLSGALRQMAPCITGAATLAVYNSGTTAAGYDFCGKLGYARGRICKKTVVKLEGIFTR